MTTPLRCLALFVACSASACAGDWPQILGPRRDGVAEDETIVDRFPANGLKPVWSRPVGDGFAGVAVRNGRFALFHRVDDVERTELLDARDAKPLWKSDAASDYSGAISADNGPRCTPLILADRVITFGATGLLRCLDLKTGKERWSNATALSFGVMESYFGAGSTPVVEGDLVIANVGGARQGAGVVAFDLASGAVRWKTTNEQASYSSPVVADVHGNRTLVVVTRLSCVGLDPKTSKVLWSFPFGARGPTVNAANPVLLGDRLFVTANYGVGAAFYKLGDTAEPLWESDELLSSHYTTPIADGGVLYGVDGRQDVGVASLRCVDPAAQKILWEQPDFGYATLIKADGKLLIQKTDGMLVLARIDRTAYRELARATVTTGTARALPALSNGRYFVRNETTLSCYKLSP